MSKENRVIVHKTTDHAGRDTQHLSLRKPSEIELWKAIDDIEELFGICQRLSSKLDKKDKKKND